VTRAGAAWHPRGMADELLVEVQARFVTSEDAEALTDRVRESLALIVGREALQEFRVRTMPLSPPKPRAAD
jgi:hypothetical protein